MELLPLLIHANNSALLVCIALDAILHKALRICVAASYLQANWDFHLFSVLVLYRPVVLETSPAVSSASVRTVASVEVCGYLLGWWLLL